MVQYTPSELRLLRRAQPAIRVRKQQVRLEALQNQRQATEESIIGKYAAANPIYVARGKALRPVRRVREDFRAAAERAGEFAETGRPAAGFISRATGGALSFLSTRAGRQALQQQAYEGEMGIDPRTGYSNPLFEPSLKERVQGSIQKHRRNYDFKTLQERDAEELENYRRNFKNDFYSKVRSSARKKVGVKGKSSFFKGLNLGGFHLGTKK